MQLIKTDINIDFIGKRKLAVVFSAILILIGLVSLVLKGGPNYGIDFAGGTLVQLKFTESTKAADIKGALKDLKMGTVTVQQFGDEPNEFLVRTPTETEIEGLGQQILETLGKSLRQRQGRNAPCRKWSAPRSVRTCVRKACWPSVMP